VAAQQPKPIIGKSNIQIIQYTPARVYFVAKQTIIKIKFINDNIQPRLKARMPPESGIKQSSNIRTNIDPFKMLTILFRLLAST
jgi:hypothetical protein